MNATRTRARLPPCPDVAASAVGLMVALPGRSLCPGYFPKPPATARIVGLDTMRRRRPLRAPSLSLLHPIPCPLTPSVRFRSPTW